MGGKGPEEPERGVGHARTLRSRMREQVLSSSSTSGCGGIFSKV